MWPFSSASPSLSPSNSTLSLSSSTLAPTPKLSNADAINPLKNPLNPEGLKPCCACPETKKLRDDCFLKYGSNRDEDSASTDKCKEVVESHLRCMRGLGFNV